MPISSALRVTCVSQDTPSPRRPAVLRKGAHTAQSPILLLSDGHTTRITMAAVHRMLAHNMKLFLTPPNATSLYQALDKLFQLFHSRYKGTIQHLQHVQRKAHRRYAINRHMAVQCIGQVVLEKWADEQRVRDAFSQVGLTPRGIDMFRVSECDLLPEAGPEDAPHDPGLPQAKLELQRKKDAFMRGPKPLESPPKLKGETKMDYERRCHCFFKEQARRLQFSPPDARGAGLLPHARESLVVGREFEMETTHRRKRKRKHPASGAVDLDAIAALYEVERAAEAEKQQVRMARMTAEAPILRALKGVGLGDKVTVKAMQALCKKMGIKGAAGRSRDALLSLLCARLGEAADPIAPIE